MILRLSILFALLCAPAFAATKYVAQSLAGSGDGSSAGNAYSMAQLNAASPYSPAAGDTVILNGTLTTTLTVPTSGSSGSPITYQFASGAKFSKAYWGTTTSAAIYATGKNYITIDGNGVGIIEDTANGDALANQQNSHGIFTTACSNWIVQNLTAQNFFVHTYGTANPGGISVYQTLAWRAEDCSSLEMSGCTVSNAYDAVVWLVTVSGTKTGFKFHDNTVTTCSTPVVIASSTSGGILDSIKVYGNDLTMGVNWYEVADANHIDGIHLWGLTGGSLTNVNEYNNYIHGDASTDCTGFIFCEGSVTASIYNNVLIGSTSKVQEGYITVEYNVTGGTYLIYNNTIKGIGTGNTGGNGIGLDPSNSAVTATIRNNVIQNCFVGIYSPTPSSTFTSDYNVIYNVGYVGWTSSGFSTLSAWQASTGTPDLHSSASTPNLNGSYVPVATSSAIGTGTNLSGTFTTGLSTSATWPNPATSTRGTTWDMGAFNVTGGGGGNSGGSSFSGGVTLKGKVILH